MIKISHKLPLGDFGGFDDVRIKLDSINENVGKNFNISLIA